MYPGEKKKNMKSDRSEGIQESLQETLPSLDRITIVGVVLQLPGDWDLGIEELKAELRKAEVDLEIDHQEQRGSTRREQTSIQSCRDDPQRGEEGR